MRKNLFLLTKLFLQQKFPTALMMMKQQLRNWRRGTGRINNFEASLEPVADTVTEPAISKLKK
jgi:hypothetical protein